jgi:hypothetical protein
MESISIPVMVRRATSSVANASKDMAVVVQQRTGFGARVLDKGVDRFRRVAQDRRKRLRLIQIVTGNQRFKIKHDPFGFGAGQQFDDPKKRMRVEFRRLDPGLAGLRHRGPNHAFMPIGIRAVSQKDFAAWVESQKQQKVFLLSARRTSLAELAGN